MTQDTTDLLQNDSKYPIEPEDSWDYYVQEQERRQEVIRSMEFIKDETVDSEGYDNWIIMKVYMFMYAKPNYTMHLNRVRGIIQNWLSITTYRELLEAQIITEEDIINHYYK